MGFVEIKEWLDKQVAIRNEMAASEEFSSRIRVIDTRFRTEKNIHIVGIKEVADMLGVKTRVEDYTEHLVRCYFIYEGYEVFELVDKDVC